MGNFSSRFIIVLIVKGIITLRVGFLYGDGLGKGRIQFAGGTTRDTIKDETIWKNPRRKEGRKERRGLPFLPGLWHGDGRAQRRYWDGKFRVSRRGFASTLTPLFVGIERRLIGWRLERLPKFSDRIFRSPKEQNKQTQKSRRKIRIKRRGLWDAEA